MNSNNVQFRILDPSNWPTDLDPFKNYLISIVGGSLLTKLLMIKWSLKICILKYFNSIWRIQISGISEQQLNKNYFNLNIIIRKSMKC